MIKVKYFIFAFLAWAFGVNLYTHTTKTDFQKKIEKYVPIIEKDKNVDSACDKCDQNKKG
ncbi:MAG: hypothetical protein AB1630_10385 [bacterium]